VITRPVQLSGTSLSILQNIRGISSGPEQYFYHIDWNKELITENIFLIPRKD
jgi:hypothetical protein